MTMFEIASIIFTMVGCAWYLGQKMNTFVTHEVCNRRRKECPCRKEIEELKNQRRTHP